MDQVTGTTPNDVPEYMSDLIPYRCPKCGHTRRFATLRELRQHLQKDHAFQMGFVKPHTRANIFDKKEITRTNIKQNHINSYGNTKAIPTTYGRQPISVNETLLQFGGKNKDKTHNLDTHIRDSSPLLQSFKDEAEVLEMEVQLAKQTEMSHKATSMINLTNSPINSDLKSSLDAIHIERPNERNKNYQHSQNLANANMAAPKTIHKPLPAHELRGTLDSLNGEVMKSRLSQWVTSDALYQSRDIIQDMEHAAEEKCKQQRSLIQQLMHDIKSKDESLEETHHEHSGLRQERERLFDETESLVKEADTYNSSLKTELNQRGAALTSLNMELEKLKAASDRELMSKDKDLQNTRDKMQRLEWERDRLVEETDRILKKADKDNDTLRQTIKSKEQELKTVNTELNEVRWNQQSMVEKTIDVYRKSEESKEMMTSVLVAKDTQLQAASEQIDRMSQLEKRLMEESHILTEQADENTNSMTKLLQMKETQAKDTLRQLNLLKREKQQLENSTSNIAEKAEISLSAVENLKGMVKKKEKDLKITQSELHNLKSFLQSTADKERIARGKLEKFIEELISRAESAEAELRTLRSQSTDSVYSAERNTKATTQNPNQQLDVGVRVTRPSDASRVGAETVDMSNVVNEPPLQFRDDIIDTSERQSLPPKLTPQKPPRKKLSNPELKAERDKVIPQWRSEHTINSAMQQRMKEHEQKQPEQTHQIVSGTANNYTIPQGLHTQQAPTTITTEAQIHPMKNENNTTPLAQLSRYDSDDQILNSFEKQFDVSEFASLPSDNKNMKLKQQYIRQNRSTSNKALPLDQLINDNIEWEDNTDEVLRELNNLPFQRSYPNLKQDMNKHHQQEIFTQQRRQKLQRRRNESPRRSQNQQNRFNNNAELAYSLPDEFILPYQYVPENMPEQSEVFQGDYLDEQYQPIPPYEFENYQRLPSTRRLNTQFRSQQSKHPKPNLRVSHQTQYGKTGSRPMLYDDHYELETLERSDMHIRKSIGHQKQKQIRADILDNRDEETVASLDTRIRQRPGVIGKSPERDIVGVANRKGNKRYEKRKGRLANPNFKSDFPSSHKSMHNISGNTAAADHANETSDDRQHMRYRRSRSLSPGHRRIQENNQEFKRDNMSANDDQDVNNSDYEDNDENESNEEEEVSDGYIELQEDTEDVDGRFHRIMDENGILWEDDMDTLPDVSDSEFDRVSPSGSEAISTKHTGLIAKSSAPLNTRPSPSSKLANPSQQKQPKQKSPLHREDNDSNQDSISNNTKSRVSSGSRKLTSQLLLSSEDKSDKEDKRSTNRAGIVKKKAIGSTNAKVIPIRHRGTYDNAHDIPGSKSFKPIKQVPPEPKTSISDKDMTSGGREVHSYMRKSPHIDIQGCSESSSNNRSQRNSVLDRSANHSKSHVRDHAEETLDAKLKRISDKYSGSRSGSSKSESQYGSQNKEFEDKISQINEKYSNRRKEISKGNGIKSNLTVSSGVRKTQSKSVSELHSDKYNSKPTMSYQVPNPISHSSEGSHHPFTDQGQGYNLGYPHHGTADPRSVSVPDFNNIHNQGYYLYNYMPMNDQRAYSQSSVPIQDGRHMNMSPYPNQMPSRFPNQDLSYPSANQYFPNQMHGFPQQFPYFPMNAQTIGQTMQQVQTDSANVLDSVPSNTSATVRKADERDNSSSKNDHTESTLGKRNVDLECDLNQTERQQRKETKIDMEKSQSEGTPTELTLEKEYESDTIIKVHTKPPTLDINSLVLEKHETEESDKISSNASLALSRSNDTIPTPTETSTVMNKKTALLSLSAEKLSSSISEGFSVFAEPIEDNSVADYGSNTQSMVDLRGSGIEGGETDVDTDTESVRRDFYENSNRIKDMLGDSFGSSLDLSRRRSPRNTMSSASSQASLEMLDIIPLNRREEVKRRRQALSCIFSFLDTAMLCRMATVCREWRLVSRSAKLWHRVELRNEKVSSKFLMYIARRCSKLRVLILEDLRPRNRKKSESIEEYQTSIRSSLESGYEHILKKSEATLHTITIINCGTLLSSKCLWAASCYSRMMTHVTYLSDFDPINAEVMWALGSGCRDLKTLLIHPIHPCQRPANFNTRCAQLIGKCFRDLERLSIGGLDVDLSALVFIAKQCQSLKQFELNHMSVVSSDMMASICEQGLKHLNIAQFISTPVDTEGLPILKENCQCLEKIVVQMSVNDFFTATKQKEDLAIYEQEVAKYVELKKADPTLAKILKTKFNQTLNVS